MTLLAQPTDSRARSLVLWCCATWMLFFSAWISLLITNGRWVPGLHGPRTLGNFLLVVAVCFFGAAIAAISAAGVTVAKRRLLPLRLRLIGFAPALCMILLVLVPATVEWGMNLYRNWPLLL